MVEMKDDPKVEMKVENSAGAMVHSMAVMSVDLRVSTLVLLMAGS